MSLFSFFAGKFLFALAALLPIINPPGQPSSTATAGVTLLTQSLTNLPPTAKTSRSGRPCAAHQKHPTLLRLFQSTPPHAPR